MRFHSVDGTVRQKIQILTYFEAPVTFKDWTSLRKYILKAEADFNDNSMESRTMAFEIIPVKKDARCHLAGWEMVISLEFSDSRKSPSETKVPYGSSTWERMIVNFCSQNRLDLKKWWSRRIILSLTRELLHFHNRY